MDSINYELEKPNLNLFIKQFVSESDSATLQKYIYFPFLFVAKACGGFIRTNNFPDATSDLALQKIVDSDSCNTPFRFLEIKFSKDKSFQKSLSDKNLTLNDFFYNEEKNRIAMTKYIIRRYHFPLIFNEQDSISYFGSQNNLINSSQRLLGIQVLFGPWVYGIAKLDGEYKIYSIGYLWD